jgi:hypothetical protein
MGINWIARLKCAGFACGYFLLTCLTPVCSIVLSQSLSNPTSLVGLLVIGRLIIYLCLYGVHSGDWFQQYTRHTINMNPKY